MINKSLPDARIAGFYNLSLDERDALLVQRGIVSQDDLPTLKGVTGLSLEQAQHMIENVVGTYALPIGLGLNFRVNGSDVRLFC
jgi:hydroxymethylglutaryl-CoA reductase